MRKQTALFSLVLLVFFFCFPFPPGLACATGTGDEDFQAWVADFIVEARSSGISEKTLARAFDTIQRRERVIELDRRQPETTITLSEYLDLKLTQSRIHKGKKMLRAHAGLLADVSAHYGVEAPIIVALWGMESMFGSYQGSHPVIDALATLAHDGRRGFLFRRELHNALKILDQGHIPHKRFTGSWAGALGQCQFMPSSFLAYAEDFDSDGRRDIWNSLPDIFASIANYLASHGWKSGYPWGFEVLVPRTIDTALFSSDARMSISWWQGLGILKLNGEALPGTDAQAILVNPERQQNRHYLVFNNYDVLRRWNRSHYFAIAAGSLADALDGT